MQHGTTEPQMWEQTLLTIIFPHSLMVLQTDMLRWISRQRCPITAVNRTDTEAMKPCQAVIYGSADGKNWTELYTIESTPAANKDTMVYYSEFNTYKEGAEPVSYRYIKYAVDANGSCNLSELKVYKSASDYTVEPVSVSLIRMEHYLFLRL